MNTVLAVTFPVFFIALVGYLYARSFKFDMASTGQLNLDVFVPAIMVYSLSEKLPEISNVSPLVTMGAIIVIGSGLMGWVVAKSMGLTVRMLLPPLMFNNSGNLGLPLALFAFGEAGIPWAVALFVITTLMHFTLGLLLLEGQVRPQILLKNPVALSMLCGLTMYFMDWHFPPILLNAIKLMADVAIPLMLVSLGFYLSRATLQDVKVGLLGAVLTPATGIISALIGSMFIDLTAQQTASVFLFAALPPAVMNSVLAERYNVEPGKVAAIVAQGNLLAIITIPLALLWILP